MKMKLGKKLKGLDFHELILLFTRTRVHEIAFPKHLKLELSHECNELSQPINDRKSQPQQTERERPPFLSLFRRFKRGVRTLNNQPFLGKLNEMNPCIIKSLCNKL